MFLGIYGACTLLLLAGTTLSEKVDAAASNLQAQALAFLAWHNSSGEIQENKDVVAQWAYYTNVTAPNELAMAKADAVFATWAQAAAKNASAFDLTKINGYSTKRLLKKISTVGIKLSSSDTQKLSQLTSKMIGDYSTAKICGWSNGTKNCSLQWLLDPDIFHFLETSRDVKGLTYVWNAWRAATAHIKPTYQTFVNLSNKGAKAGGFADTGAWWRSWYETKNFRGQLRTLYLQILPLYENLHAYVRHKLSKAYPGAVNDSYIPAQLTGNMWAQEWQNIFPLVQPFKNVSAVDVTGAMKAQGYTPNKMFHTADNFFRSLGLIPMPPAFWNGTIMTKPNRPFVCHASAWDFYNRKDYRIKMCTRVNMNDLITIHHEMGHIQYYLQYSNQPVSFREGANPGFHEGIGDTLALSVATPKHLKAIGLLPKNYTSNPQQEINYLLKQAMEKVAFLPWGYLMDMYRWEIFNGSLPYNQWNQGWWKLRNQFQGIKAPVSRPANAFDPASKSHTDDNTPYIRYFVSFIVQFQFYKSMCNAAGYTGPLNQCDFYKNRAAGTRLANMLSMGSSKPWPQAMNRMTGQTTMDASAILEYFKPLSSWLTTQNIANKQCYGWGYPWPHDVLCSLPQPRCGFPNLNCGAQKSTRSPVNPNAAPQTNLNKIAYLLPLIASLVTYLRIGFQ